MGHTETYIDGVYYPSVTTIIDAKPKPWLEKWRTKWGKRAERKTEIANAIGTEFHRCVEEYILTGTFALGSTGYPTSCAPRIAGMMESFIDWAQGIDGEIHGTEIKVISKVYTYSGTLDAVGTFEGKPMVYDWKTSSKIYDDMELQLSAYSRAYKEQRGYETKQGLIVCVSKDKPRFKLTTRLFKLGKRSFNKFLILKRKFEENRNA